MRCPAAGSMATPTAAPTCSTIARTSAIPAATAGWPGCFGIALPSSEPGDVLRLRRDARVQAGQHVLAADSAAPGGSATEPKVPSGAGRKTVPTS